MTDQQKLNKAIWHIERAISLLMETRIVSLDVRTCESSFGAVKCRDLTEGQLDEILTEIWRGSRGKVKYPPFREERAKVVPFRRKPVVPVNTWRPFQ